MSVGYFREDASEERCNAAREGVDHSALLPDVKNTHPKCENACEPDRNLKTIFGSCEGGVEDFRKDVGLSKGKKLYAAHDDR